MTTANHLIAFAVCQTVICEHVPSQQDQRIQALRLQLVLGPAQMLHSVDRTSRRVAGVTKKYVNFVLEKRLTGNPPVLQMASLPLH